jgi:CDP-diacylglycerol--glycerol-3-phosphate 3-phosphatidyltransferase
LFDSVSDRWGEPFVLSGYVWLLHDSAWLLAALSAIGGSMMVSYTRARAEGLGIQLAGGMMQRAERIMLVAVGTLIAAWYGDNLETASAVASIVGATMLICGVASTATAVNRWLVGYRELARRYDARNDALDDDERIGSGLSPASVPSRVLMPHVRKVAPLEQH